MKMKMLEDRIAQLLHENEALKLKVEELLQEKAELELELEEVHDVA
jgi:regulator of replication initiation timing